MLRTVAVTLLVFAFSSTLGAAALAADQGQVIVAKTQGNGIILWDVTPEIATITSAPDAPAKKTHDLEISAARVLLAHLAEMKAATTVEVRVFYRKTGDLNQEYQVNTFAGVEKIFTIVSQLDAANRNKTLWEKQLATGVLPAGITVKDEGTLPQ